MEHQPRPTKESVMPPTDKSIADMPEAVAVGGTRETESSDRPAVPDAASPRDCMNVGGAAEAKHLYEESLTSSLAGVGTLEFVFRCAKS
jgi:hypothetical protein